jgi:hypothetical protein
MSAALKNAQQEERAMREREANARAASDGRPLPYSSGLATCLTGEATNLRFPRHRDSEVAFKFPLVYKKGQ